MRVLGIDPGLTRCGLGMVDGVPGRPPFVLAVDVLRTSAQDETGARLAQVEESTTSLLSETEDADIAKAMIDLTTQQSVYKAALQSGQSLIQPSLLDFLR